MKFIFLKKINKKAFSLIELSIVIVIISILLSGALSIVTTTSNKSKIRTTNNNISEIYKALKVYLVANKRLPCPAPITAVKSTDTNYGHSSGAAGSCSESGVYGSNINTTIVYGMVPVKDLGLSIDMAEDGFGSKFSYVVDARYTGLYTDSTNFGSDDSLYELIEIKEVTSAGATEISKETTFNAIFAVISYGANKSGAFNANSSSQNSASTDTYEIANGIVPTDSITATLGDNSTPYRIYSYAGRSDVFDDIILYKTRNMLVAEADAFNLIKCPAGVNQSLYGDTIVWPEGEYGQAVPAVTDCPSAGYQKTIKHPTKRCGAFGEWQDGVVDPCTYSATSSTSTLNCSFAGVTPTTSGGNTILTITSSGNLVCTGSGPLNYLVVGGGGGGGGDDTDLAGGGGGGGGGVVESGSYAATAGTIVVTVGNGGSGGTSAASPTSGSNGQTSSLGAIASAAGGFGGHFGGNNVGTGGGSGAKTGGASGICPGPGGGGNSHGGGGGGASSFSNGNDGGRLSTNPSHGGGAGASGTANSITGSSQTYGGGGGGGAGGETSEGSSSPVQGAGAGGAGGGGIGNRNAVNDPGAGTANTGGGGGGGGKSDNGAAGGKGVVIVSFTTP